MSEAQDTPEVIETSTETSTKPVLKVAKRQVKGDAVVVEEERAQGTGTGRTTTDDMGPVQHSAVKSEPREVEEVNIGSFSCTRVRF